MTYRSAMKWAIVPAIGIIFLVVGNGAYYYIDQPDRWHNSFIGVIPAVFLVIYAVCFLCLAVVVTLVHLVRKSPTRA